MNIEVWALSVVAHEERPAVVEAAVQMHDGMTLALAPVDYAIARLENEATHAAHAR